MKKKLLLMSLVLSAGLFSACSSDDEMGGDFSGDLFGQSSEAQSDSKDTLGVFTPVDVIEYDKEMTDFFNSELYINCDWPGDSPFFTDFLSEYINDRRMPDKDICYVINNQEYLKRLYHGDKDLPKIDFKKYTLIIGMQIMPNAFFKIESQELISEKESLHLTLHVSLPKDRYTPYLFTQMYYWGLYPKVKDKDIEVDWKQITE